MIDWTWSEGLKDVGGGVQGVGERMEYIREGVKEESEAGMYIVRNRKGKEER